MSFTYATLKTAIQNYTDNTETTFVSTLDTFIKTVEDRILTSVDLEYFRKNATASMTSSNQYLAVPSDFLSSFSISIINSSSKEFLLQKDVNFVQEFNPNSSTTGTPRYYARFDNSNFIVAPTPDANYVTEVHYYYRPTSLTAGSDSGTTWLSTNAPNALLYGCLMEAYTFMKGEQDVMAMYEKRFAEALSRLKDFGEARENADAFRRGLPDRPRT
jgi:hypothetical protein|tara:strand:+ start:410 stop:1057 length:648 start_codon:yes stop_codon:yes gene_type:complete